MSDSVSENPSLVSVHSNKVKTTHRFRTVSDVHVHDVDSDVYDVFVQLNREFSLKLTFHLQSKLHGRY